MKKIKFIALTLLALMAIPYSALAVDIPLLTWERGRQQQVAFAVGLENRSWEVELVKDGIEPLQFSPSTVSPKGFVVYTIELSKEVELGSYSVVATNDRGTSRTIAGVIVIEAITRTAGDNLFDLTALIAVFSGITILISTLRTRKYSQVTYRTSQTLDENSQLAESSAGNFWTRLEEAPYLARIGAINSLKESLPRFLIIREGELAHRSSKSFYGIAPLLGLMAGVFVSVQISQSGGYAKLTLTALLVLLALSIYDALTGIFITMGFWMIQLVTGNVTSIRDVLIQIAIGITLVGPSLFSTMLRGAITQDAFFNKNQGRDFVRGFGVVGSALFGTSLFYLGHALLMSILYVEAPQLELSIVQLLLVTAVLAAKGFSDFIFDSESYQNFEDQSQLKVFHIARTTSPITALCVAFLIGSFVFIWTENVENSLTAAAIYSLPYLLGFIGFKRRPIAFLSKVPRNLILESLVGALLVFLIFRQISGQPVLLDQRIESLLLLGALPALVHSVLSAIYASQEQTFTTAENHGRIDS
jgi:hypothetical protein